jgi:FAD:protein FMN transferase
MKVYQHHTYAMGTRFSLVIPGMDEDEGSFLGEEVDKILIAEENRLSRFREESEVSLLNQKAFAEEVTVSAEMNQVLDLCDFYYKATQGAFDPALLSVTAIKKSNQANPFPSQDNLKGWEQVSKNEKKVRFLQKETGIDLGGFGKGWAMEKTLEFLRNNKISSAFISFGESTVSVIGNHPLGQPWQMDIPNPSGNKALTLHLSDESISVSGLKTKNTEHGNVQQPHIYSPDKGSWVRDERLVLVKDRNALHAETLSTALIAAGIQQKIAIFEAFPDSGFFECKSGNWIQLEKGK